MARFAENTSVPVEKSKAEIEATLARYGATEFMSGWDQTRAMLQFRAKGRIVRFQLPLPDRDAEEFRMTPAKKRWRSDDEAHKAWEQACRQRWRALALCIKAKLEAVEAGITEFEAEFLAHIVLPDGSTVGGFMAPQIAAAYETGAMPKLLPAPEKSLIRTEAT